LKTEFEEVVGHSFSLEFKYPSEDERRTMRVVNRDMTQLERTRVKEARKNAENLANLLGVDVNIEDIPEDVRRLLIEKLTGGKK
jgi:superfamily I DNA and RNA helicase